MVDTCLSIVLHTFRESIWGCGEQHCTPAPLNQIIFLQPFCLQTISWRYIYPLSYAFFLFMPCQLGEEKVQRRVAKSELYGDKLPCPSSAVRLEQWAGLSQWQAASFSPGVSQQVAPLWILSPLSYGPLHLVYLEVSPPTLFKGLIPLNKKKGSYMWWLTVSCRHDFKQAERKTCKSDKGLEWTMNSAKKINWIGPRRHHDQETLALYHEKRFASRHPSSVTRLMTRLGLEDEERIQWVGWGGLQ